MPGEELHKRANGMDTKRSGVVVLGMHRSGTSAITGVLRLCGAWVGEDERLTAANVENPLGFWERRDVRKICDGLLHSAGADWWKVAGLNLEAIPHAILSEQRRLFAGVVSELREHGPWVVKEPRLCLLLPLLRDYLNDAVCVHVFRNPLEVARSLQRRNGFSIAAGMALWETYSRHALEASATMPRVMVAYAALMRDPEGTIDRLVTRLEALGVMRLAVPSESEFGEFIQPAYHRHRVTEEETDPLLTPGQRELWRWIRSEEVLAQEPDEAISAAAAQHLYDLESAQQSLGHLEDRIGELNARLVKYREKLAVRESELVSRQKEVAARDRELARRAREVAARDVRIRDLLGSTSWRVTAPLRALSVMPRKSWGAIPRSIRWIRRATKRGLVRTARSASPGGASPVGGSSYAGETEYFDTHAVGNLVRRYREINDRAAGDAPTGTPPRPERRPRVSVIAWNLGHNALGRAYLLADLLRSDHDVEIVGAIFDQFGTELWGPLRGDSRVTMKSFPGGEFPDHFARMEEVARQIEGDVIYVSKPRLPAVELAILAKLHRNRPIVLDVDDYELAFFRNRGALTFEEVTRSERNRDFHRPQAETWTRYCESLVPLFDQITVSNEELQKRYGGVVLPHVRSEHDFDPAAYPRDEIRAELGFGPEDRVILFAGTLRMHKGVARIVDAVKKLRHVDCKLMIVGTAPDDETGDFLRGADSTYVKVISDVPFLDLPGYLCAGDLVCLLQDPDDVNSQYQMPAKFTDALAMGIPILASNVPPLANLARDGLVELLGNSALEKKIEEVFANYPAYLERARTNRERFLSQYSYGACRPWMNAMIGRVLESPSPTPDEFRDLVDYHRGVFSGSGPSWGLRNGGLTVRLPCEAPISGDGVTIPPLVPRPPRCREFVDDRYDIVLFWKQNDTGIYGRRHDMVLKYLSRDPRVERVLLFDAPVSVFGSGATAVKSGPMGRHSHSGRIFRQLLRQKLRLSDTDKIRFDTYLYVAKNRAPRALGWLLPSETNYLDYLQRVLDRHEIGGRRTVFWVCPNNFHFPAIERRFEPDLVVADVIDDQRKWDVTTRRRKELTDNYREVLGRSHLVFANCGNVVENMREFTGCVHLFPNASELVEEQSRSWDKPRELKRMNGPIVGYVGNLDAARIDIDLLTAVARERPQWNLVFIGSMHRGKEIKRLGRFPNVHFFGVQVYERAMRFVRHFDVAMIPHADNELTRHMNPLKLYVYLSLHVPVVSTMIENIDDSSEFVEKAGNAGEFVDAIDRCLNENPIAGRKEALRRHLQANSWDVRVAGMLGLIEEMFADREAEVAGTSD